MRYDEDHGYRMRKDKVNLMLFREEESAEVGDQCVLRLKEKDENFNISWFLAQESLLHDY